MPDPLDGWDAAGTRLALADYRADFRAVDSTLAGQDSWKLERRQHFRQPGTASWEAFARGEWDEALRLIEARRGPLMKFGAEAAEKGTGLYRLRVVAQPIIPYLQWELHSLKLRAECGELIRILPAAAVRDLEDDGELPEIVTLGPSVAYHILYDANGELTGGVKVTDPRAVGRATDLIRRLYARGEDVAEFFEREVAPLPPPRVNSVPTR
ncbi:MAG: hypothetical protein J2P25_03145 [Nocardiopsaceae bacterium]|nr:hypothetical protein [Nocardiopsaceae bacterium]